MDLTKTWKEERDEKACERAARKAAGGERRKMEALYVMADRRLRECRASGGDVRPFVSPEVLTFWRDVREEGAGFTAASFGVKVETVHRAWARHPERHPEAEPVEIVAPSASS
jgi:hypothetical protein